LKKPLQMPSLFLDYFEDTFIGRPGRHNRLGPVFSLHIWNMYDRTAQHQHHRKLSPWIPVSHWLLSSQHLQIQRNIKLNNRWQ
jgi:hypothetical protein